MSQALIPFSVRSMIRQSVLRVFGIDPIRIEFDAGRGIPIINYGTRCGVYIGKQTNPLFVALYGCRALGLEPIIGPILVPPLEGTVGRQYIRTAVDWLVSTEIREDCFSVWECDFPWPSSHLLPPWRSALTEGFGAIFLLAAGRKQDARRHLEAMMTDHKQGGTAYVDANSLWFLEYGPNEPVLNGMLHCLVNLHESSCRLNDTDLKRAFNLAFATLKRDLHLFDAQFYTFYDSRKNPADDKYHRLHVELLRILYEMTKDSDLKPWIERWTSYQRLYPLVEPVIFLRHLISSGTALFT